MPIERTITVTVGRKVTKNYCSLDVHLGGELLLLPGEDAEEVTAEAVQRLKARLAAALATMNGGAE